MVPHSVLGQVLWTLLPIGFFPSPDLLWISAASLGLSNVAPLQSCALGVLLRCMSSVLFSFSL